VVGVDVPGVDLHYRRVKDSHPPSSKTSQTCQTDPASPPSH
jgi:hypothetical protein